MAVALFIAGSSCAFPPKIHTAACIESCVRSGIKMTVAIPCVPPPALFADCFSLAVFPAHVSDAQDGGHGLWFASGCSRCTALTALLQPLPPNACTSSSVVQFFAVAAPPASAPTVKRAVDQPPDPTLELRCDAHRCLAPSPQ